jgi:hypothetical protein
MKPDTILVVAWWLWLGPALMVLVLPVRWGLALLIRGRESVASSGIGEGGFAILGAAAVPFILGILPFVLLSLLYGFLFWRHRERGIALSARFWIPIYGSTFVVLILIVMAFVTLSREQGEYGPLRRVGSEVPGGPTIRRPGSTCSAPSRELDGVPALSGEGSRRPWL